MTVKGNLTAEQYIISSSIYYVTQSSISGSSNFGNSLDDTHTMTGSLGLTGSLSVAGPLTINGTSYTAATSGTSGAQGAAGSNGAQGATGPQGAAGSNGAQGATGAQGAAGTNGSNGAQGAAGAQGATGPQGNQGPTGGTGPQGPTGPTGNPFGGGTFTGGIAVQGAITATGDITAYDASDRRLKDKIHPIVDALAKVNKISGNTFDWKEGFDEIHSHKGKDIGVIAQEIQEILPEIVSERANGYLGVRYEKIVALLIEAIKEQQKQIEEIKQKIG